ncbi:MAG: lysylphosphatidylglycerol synthase transmembrane domain-containing protein [Candidatus Aenigmatarchaeota archaeon]
MKNLIMFLAFSVIIYSVLIVAGDYNKIADKFKLFNLWVIPVVMLFAWADDFIRFLKWDYFLKKIKIRVEKKTSFLIFFSGLAMSITPGKVGEVLKSYLLKKTVGVKMRKSIMVVVFERLTDVLALSILALLGAFSFLNNPYFIFLIAFLIFTITLAFVLLSNKKVFFKFSKVLVKIPIVKKYVKYINDIHKTSQQLLSPKVLATSTLMSVASWFLECLGFYILLHALGAPLPILTVTFIFSFSSIFGSIIFLPGGLGAAESSFVALLLFSGLTITTATLATILIRLTTLFWGILIGLVCLSILSRWKK